MEENKTDMQLSEIGIMINRIIPTTKFFESRFELLQNKYEEVRRGQDKFENQLRDLKLDMDRRFNETHINMQERFAILDRRIDDTRSDMVERFRQVDNRFEQVDKRFEQVDKRFEQVDMRLSQIITSIDNLGNKMDLKIDNLVNKMDSKDDRQRKFTLKMFSIAISITGLSVMGVLIKVLNII
jgi:chromosome segregation ATPase